MTLREIVWYTAHELGTLKQLLEPMRPNESKGGGHEDQGD